jgi:hypothetical protein
MWDTYLRQALAGISSDLERERLADELRDHLEALYEDLRAAGLDPEAARGETLRRFGTPAVVSEGFTVRSRAASPWYLAAFLAALGLFFLSPPIGTARAFYIVWCGVAMFQHWGAFANFRRLYQEPWWSTTRWWQPWPFVPYGGLVGLLTLRLYPGWFQHGTAVGVLLPLAGVVGWYLAYWVGGRQHGSYPLGSLYAAMAASTVIWIGFAHHPSWMPPMDATVGGLALLLGAILFSLESLMALIARTASQEAERSLLS